jgi:hypothetical protein
METFKRSDTWKKARTGTLRGALLLLWAESWQEQPCGTLPDDDELIALMIDMPAATFAKNRDVLRRGWRLASDGRLYHETITKRVLAMLEKRAKDAKRTADRRARIAGMQASHVDVTCDTRETIEEQTGEFDTKHQAPIEIPPNPPKGASVPIAFKTWLSRIREAGEQAIPESDPVFAYVKRVGVPLEFVRLHWVVFRNKYLTATKRQRDWRQVFRNSVEGNWYHLWRFRPDGECVLSDVGEQARRDQEERQKEPA